MTKVTSTGTNRFGRGAMATRGGAGRFSGLDMSAVSKAAFVCVHGMHQALKLRLYVGFPVDII